MKTIIKKTKYYLIALSVGVVFLLNIDVQAGDMANRIFFQTISSYDDGGSTRWTGCINTGGSCWSESIVVADCSWNGGQTWIPCNNIE